MQIDYSNMDSLCEHLEGCINPSAIDKSCTAIEGKIRNQIHTQ